LKHIAEHLENVLQHAEIQGDYWSPGLDAADTLLLPKSAAAERHHPLNYCCLRAKTAAQILLPMNTYCRRNPPAEHILQPKSYCRRMPTATRIVAELVLPPKSFCRRNIIAAED
jgi:hypothetical protein